ncbi:hypothetical protein E5D57_009500 [Metarhizium anisopliae]|nr:hypothetical protein E5D57_009500 [Metarhizium anisopliae]
MVYYAPKGSNSDEWSTVLIFSIATMIDCETCKNALRRPVITFIVLARFLLIRLVCWLVSGNFFIG